MADGLRLKVSAAEYMQRIAMLDNKVSELRGILAEYQTLQNDAVKVLGDDDSNLGEMRASVQQNIDAVNGEIELLLESRTMLQQQMENLQELSGHVSNMFQEAKQTARTAFNTVKIVGDLVN